MKRFLEAIFYSNYFIGFLAVALSLETAFQLHIPFANIYLYLFLFSGTIVFYTLAYQNSYTKKNVLNPREAWYATYSKSVKVSQILNGLILFISIIFILKDLFPCLGRLSIVDYGLMLLLPIIGFLYYWKPPKQILQLKLRNYGVAKSFSIGIAWAIWVSGIPFYNYLLTNRLDLVSWKLFGWYFIKNMMFCAVNAIIFDIKDYEEDTNKDLKTLVVKLGIHKTLYRIVVPLLIIGIISMVIFNVLNNSRLVSFIINLLPFLLLLILSFRLGKRQNILYYLIAIDGALLVKAACGILGVYLTT